MNPFDIYSGRINQSGSNTRIELRKEFREALEKRGASVEKKVNVPMVIQDQEEDGCIIVKLYFHHKQQQEG